MQRQGECNYAKLSFVTARVHRKRRLSERKRTENHNSDAPTAAQKVEWRAKGEPMKEELRVLGLGAGDWVAFNW